MKRILLFLTMAAALLAATSLAQAESLLIGTDGERFLGTLEWIHGQQFFVQCPDGIRFSLTKYKVKLVAAPGQECHYPISTDSAVAANDDPAAEQAEEEAHKAYEAKRARIRKILAEYGYKVPDSDLK